jgi:hypothetical protein
MKAPGRVYLVSRRVLASRCSMSSCIRIWSALRFPVSPVLPRWTEVSISRPGLQSVGGGEYERQ